MRRTAFVIPLVLWPIACGPSSDTLYSGALPERVDFNFHVKPILSDRCFACHGPDARAREAELRVDIEDGIRGVLGSGVFGRNEVLRRITARDSSEVMPPPESGLTLSDYDKAILARWMEQGAEYAPHWAFVPPTTPEPPEVENDEWMRTPIDRFVLARLEREALTPAPEADRTRLIRRVTYDLTGLPPTVAAVERFLRDTSASAYEDWVDRLLASPAYGERMASQWLDLARYADSHGYQDDGVRFMWGWRDWVIRAFNENLPYDAFVTVQLAGDLLPDATRDQILATGFNRNHAQTAEGGIVDEEYRVAYVVDRVKTVGRGLLGLSTDCAQCHDHKYDPITQEEYYQLFAFFNNVDEIGLGAIDGNNGPVLLLPDEATEQRLDVVRGELRSRERSLREYRERIAHDAQYARKAARARSDLERGLIGHFSFDTLASVARRTPNAPAGAPPLDDVDRIAPNLADASNPVTFQGEPRIVPGKSSHAFEVWDGAVGIVGDAYAFDRFDGFSFSVWVYPTRTHTRAPIVTRALADNAGANRGYELNLHHDSVFFGMMHIRSDDAIRVQTTATLPLNRWTHLAVTYDGTASATGLAIYVDGRRAAVAVLSDHLRRTSVPSEDAGARFQIGGKRAGSDVASFEGGRIDEVRVYDRPLSALEVAELAGGARGDSELARNTGAETVTPAQDARFEHYLTTEDTAYAGRLAALRGSLAEETRLLNGVEDVMVMSDRITPRPTHLLERGAYDAPRGRIESGTPGAILPFDDALPRNRLGFARWLFDDRNPLTARVAVNRYWQMLFGSGLVETADDFGNQGALPTHPELLDWLAVTYRDSDWDTKALLKRIVVSSTYRQSSRITPELEEVDPENRLLARGPSHRLPAEMIRDGALAVSGLLVDDIGGPSVKPYQPDSLWEEKSAGRGALASYVQDTGPNLYRRSLYTFRKLSSPPPMLVGFDAPDRSVCTVRRQETNTPLQGLALMNDPQFVEAARALAERMMTEGGSGVGERLGFGFRAVTARKPTGQEVGILRSLYERQADIFADDTDAAERLLSVGERPREASLNAAALAAYAMVASTLLNLDEAVTKR